MMPFMPQFEHLKIQLETIKSATNNFDDAICIGKGGFGKVYKGELVDHKGHTILALKRLDRSFGQGNPEFWKEIIMLSLYKHENIVSLLGFCDESNEKVLMYEYASRGSLDLYLNSEDLSWVQRLRICIGAARGLEYLHNPGATQQRVLHRDIKSSNILLDENWNARISDLGLSKFGPANQQYTFLVSNTVGTIGYCDPLYVETGLLTKESDVYSFGVVLFEILCGRLCIDNKNDKCRSLTRLVREYYEQNKIKEIVYGDIKDEIESSSLEAFTTIAYQCLKKNLRERPSMTKVLRILENALRYQLGDANDQADYNIYDDLDKASSSSQSIPNIMSEKKHVFEVGLWSESIKERVMRAVSDISGVDSISTDMKNNTLTITGDVDPMMVKRKLRRICYAWIVSSDKKADDENICHNYQAMRRKMINYQYRTIQKRSCTIK